MALRTDRRDRIRNLIDMVLHSAQADGAMDRAAVCALCREVEDFLSKSVLDELRRDGWMVVCHNDYRLNGVLMTWWSFARGSQYVKGEGHTDAEALDQCMSAVRDLNIQERNYMKRQLPPVHGPVI